MQTREQVKNWKVVASVATVAALGVSGLAVASPRDNGETPPPIEIEDRRSEAGISVTSTTEPRFEVVPGPSVTPGVADSLDTPLASAEVTPAPAASKATDSPDDVDSAGHRPVTTVADSPDVSDSPAAPADPAPADSPDPVDSAPDSPDVADSPASGDSVDSLDS